MPKWRDFDFFPPSRPIAVKGGIRARSKRGAFGTQWWARRWIATLEALNLGGRLQRARSYARRGQVVSIEIARGRVTADVQGSRPKPYRVSIDVKEIPTTQWKMLAARFSESPLHLARLLAGEMPEDIETLFAGARLSLFPARASELRTDCSCPDWSNPCKHIAAVYYLLGEEFDRDPFLIFRLRGVTREELSEFVGERASRPSRIAGSGVTLDRRQSPALSLEHFWEGTAATEDLFGDVAPPATSAPILRRLGGFPFWRGETDLVEALAPIYPAAASLAMAAFAGSLDAAPRLRPVDHGKRRGKIVS